jgi:hypothetical protein
MEMNYYSAGLNIFCEEHFLSCLLFKCCTTPLVVSNTLAYLFFSTKKLYRAATRGKLSENVFERCTGEHKS